MTDFKKEWLEKAEVDYFAQFMSLWLGFNSWYRSHYSELDKNDRQLIEKLKSDFTGRNQLYTNFDNLIRVTSSKENLKFKSNLESFHYSLNSANISYPKGHHSCHISFQTALYNYHHRNDPISYLNLIRRSRQPSKIRLDEVFITSELDKFFPCLLEIIYQLRCLLFHGNLQPTKDNHEVIKYCYFILLALLQ